MDLCLEANEYIFSKCHQQIGTYEKQTQCASPEMKAGVWPLLILKSTTPHLETHTVVTRRTIEVGS